MESAPPKSTEDVRVAQALAAAAGVPHAALPASARRHADEVAALSAAGGVETAVSELDGGAAASWVEDDLLFVLLCNGELAFNRLLSHVASLTINP